MNTDLSPQTPTRRRAIFRIGDSTLADLIRLPAGQYVIGLHADPETLTIGVHLAGEGLPEVHECAMPTVLNSHFGYRLPFVTATDPDTIHAEIQAALAVPGHLEASASYQARRAQLDRHQPHTDGFLPAGVDAVCGWCIDPTEREHLPHAWPCPDYLAAAAPVTVTSWTPDRDDPETARP